MIEFSYLPELRWLIGGAVAGVAVLLASYLLAKGGSRRALRIGLASLRGLIIGAVVLCLLDPERVEAIRHEQKARLAVLLDTSRSMATKDVPQGRLAVARSWLEKRIPSSARSNVTVDYYAFDQSLAPLLSLASANATGDGTGLADALDGLLAVPRKDPLVGVVLCSDGIENLRADAEAAAKRYRRKGIPIHTLTVGTTNDQQDIIVENVQVKSAVPNQSPIKAAIDLRTSGYRDQAVPVQILRRNQVVAFQTVTLKEGGQRVEIEFTPRERGFQIYEVRVPEQKGEWLFSNNRKQFGLEVVDATIRVIYMEGTPQQPSSPIPEWKYLKDALESDPNIKVKTLYRQLGANGQFLNTLDSDPETGVKIYPVEHPTHGFPRTMDELLNYDVIIHSDIKKESFTADQLQNIAKLVEEHGGGFVMIGGNSAFGKGGYHRTILDRIIPVAMEQENDSQARPFRLQVPPTAFSHPMIALGATREETERIWNKKFPILYGCNLVDRAKPGAVVLGEDPLLRNAYGPRLILAVQNIGKGRSMAFTSDTTRTWGRDFETTWGEPVNPSLPVSERNCDSRYYRQFWVNAVRWLASGRLGRTNSPVSLELARSYCLPDQQVTATVKVRDRELNAIDAADVTLMLSAGDKTNPPVNARFDRVRQSYSVDLLPPGAGDYIVTAVANRRGEKLGEDRQLLMCESTDREMADLRARPDLMANIARITRGEALTPTDGGPVPSLFGAPPPATVEYRRTPLWDRSWWLGTIVFLLTVEWVVRRLNGLA